MDQEKLNAGEERAEENKAAEENQTAVDSAPETKPEESEATEQTTPATNEATDQPDTEEATPAEETSAEETSAADAAPEPEVEAAEAAPVEEKTEKSVLPTDAPEEVGLAAIPEGPKKRSGSKRIMTGKVVSNKPEKTIIVKTERQVAHPLYKKYYKRSKKVTAHDERNECNIGDVVQVRESRPLSAKKRWTLIEIVERAK